MDRAFWDQLWEQTLREHGDKIAGKAPNAWLVAELATAAPGRALDAGCGHGAESLWLAAHGWRVTAVDFSAAALAQGAAMAATAGLADRIDWQQGDLSTVAPAAYDLVVCLYVHLAGPSFIARMASGVAPGGTLFMVGHQGLANQTQISVERARAELPGWDLVIAEERPRAKGGVDAVIRARRPA